jgi:hypothetical protein
LLEADIELPAGAQVIDLGASGTITAGEARFSEERLVEVEVPHGDAPGAVHLLLRRRWQLPLSRVPLTHYDEVAGELRQVDPLELGEIRVELPTGSEK